MGDVVELLQGIGLTQYEAEAYHTLLRYGPLTGYEVGKRSRVPQPRAYDVLERLAERGLALVQPGQPPRYRAVPVEDVVARTRSRVEATLDQLEQLLSGVSADAGVGEFWVLRGAGNIADRCVGMVSEARRSIAVVAPDVHEPVRAALRDAADRGCDAWIETGRESSPGGDALLVMIDESEVLLGTAGADEALLTTNRAVVGIAASYAGRQAAGFPATERANTTPQSPDWLRWEDAKHRRLRAGRDVA